MTREEVEEVMRASEPIQASFEVIGDDVKFVKLIVNGKEKVISIEELENTLSEPCDCISREEVCDYIAEFVNHEYATDRERELVKHIIGGIQHLPSIQPTTKENLVVEDCISRKAVLDALNKWDWQELYLPVHFKDIIDDLPSIQPKPKTECSCEQIKWERDIAIEQLHELGHELGQKIEPCEDCISRKAVLDLVEDMTDQFGVEHRVITGGVISMLPPVTPQPKTDVLDKIMKEIKEIYADIDDVCIKNGLNLARRIINKYKAESEDKE